nr:hypothetical protein BaRGS_027402 [Batillaria attramentaria]
MKFRDSDSPSLQAPAQEDPLEHFNHHVREEAKSLFVAFDYNDDGSFDHRDLEIFLNTYDLNKNGAIERDEFEHNFDMTEPTLAIVAKGLFIEFDSDKSEHVTMADLEALYNRMDLNKDGHVANKEFEEYMTEVKIL